MSLKPLWFVLSLDVKPDPRKGAIFGQQVDVAADQAFAAPPNVPNQEPQQPLPRGGRFQLNRNRDVPAVGVYINGLSVKDLDRVFYSHEAASSFAKEQAELHPKCPYGVFLCGEIYETTTPTVLEKEFNEVGELRMKEKKHG